MKKGRERLVCENCGSDLRRQRKWFSKGQRNHLCRNRMCSGFGHDQKGITIPTMMDIGKVAHRGLLANLFGFGTK